MQRPLDFENVGVNNITTKRRRYSIVCDKHDTNLVKWPKLSFSVELEMTQLTCVFIAQVQPFLHTRFVHESEAPPAITRANQRLLPIDVISAPGRLADPTCRCSI